MKKESIIKNIQKRLPNDIVIEDETDYEFTDDEYISILSWIKCFNKHYEENGKNKDMPVKIPLISKRMALDFGLYRLPNDLEHNKGKHIIYLTKNGRRIDGTIEPNITVDQLIENNNL